MTTLGKFIEAMGGRLQVRAVFPDGSVPITGFQTTLKEAEESWPRQAGDIEELELHVSTEELDRLLSTAKESMSLFSPY